MLYSIKDLLIKKKKNISLRIIYTFTIEKQDIELRIVVTEDNSLI